MGIDQYSRQTVITACDEDVDLPFEPFRETPAGPVFPRKATLRPPQRLLPRPDNEVQYLYLESAAERIADVESPGEVGMGKVRITRKDFLDDRQGKTFADVVNDAEQPFDKCAGVL